MNNRILVFGDSVVWGAFDLEGGWANRLKRYTDKQIIGGKENYNTVYPLGVPGNNSNDLLMRFEGEVKSRLDEESNIIIIVAIGINDSQFNVITNENRVSLSQFEQNLFKIINTSSDYAKEIVLVDVTPVNDELLNPMSWKPTHGYSNSHIAKYNSALKSIVKKSGANLINASSVFRDKDLNGFLNDGLHPNDEGHELMFEKILKDLKNLNILD